MVIRLHKTKRFQGQSRPCTVSLTKTIVFTILLCTAACQPRITTHGFMPRNDLIEKLQPGHQDKLQVANILGTPTVIATFDENIWYYITQTTENQSFFKPKLVDQQILALKFDSTGTLSSLATRNIVDAKHIEPNPGKTPTAGRDISVFQQLFGNFGRFSGPAEKTY